MSEYQEVTESRARFNLERTASNKVTRSLTLRDGIAIDDAKKVVDDAIALFIHAESMLAEKGIVENSSSVNGKVV